MTLYVFFSFVAFLLYAQAAFYFLRATPKTKVNILFDLKLLSLALISLIITIIHFTDQVHAVYQLDRLGVFGWISFPVLTSSFFYAQSNISDKRIGYIIRFVLSPIALAILIRYLYQPETLKLFYLGESGIWYFKTNIESIWTKLSIVYLSSNTVIVVYSVSRWLMYHHKSIYKKERIKANIIFTSLLLFIIISLGSHIVLPLLGAASIPAMIHIAALPMMAGIFFTTVITHPNTFFSEMISQILMQRIKEFVFYLDHNGLIYSVNEYTAETMGYSVSELKNNAPSIFLRPSTIITTGLESIEMNDKSPAKKCFLITKTGEKIPVSINMQRINDALNNTTGFLMIASDYRQTNILKKEHKQKLRIEKKLRLLNNKLSEITRIRNKGLIDAKNKLNAEQEKQLIIEQKIYKELKAKQEVLREIHHRVKNNMQIIVSLINIEHNKSKTPKRLKNSLNSIAGRIRDISVIHDYLYDSPYMGKIDFSKFITKTSDELASRHPNKEQIFFNVSTSDDELTIEKAIPCGIIVFELINNSLKYAFSKPRQMNNHETDDHHDFKDHMVIYIEFFRESGRFKLQVKDNGKGMALTNNQPKQKKIGLTLVDVLVNEYLHGDISYETNNGTAVSISF